MPIWASTCRKADANNQRTGAWRSTADSGSACTPALIWVSSLMLGKHQALATTPSSVSMVQAGKWSMPKRSNQAPAANTVTKNPSEPHKRTRP